MSGNNDSDPQEISDDDDLQSEDGDEAVIDAVKKYKVLWDNSRSDFKQVGKKERAWDRIGGALNRKTKEVKKAWSRLRRRFSSESRKMRLVSYSGAGLSEYKKWAHYERMRSFITVQHRGDDTVTNVSTKETSDRMTKRLLETTSPWSSMHALLSQSADEEEELQTQKNDMSEESLADHGESSLPAQQNTEDLKSKDAQSSLAKRKAEEFSKFEPKTLTGGSTSKIAKSDDTVGISSIVQKVGGAMDTLKKLAEKRQEVKELTVEETFITDTKTELASIVRNVKSKKEFFRLRKKVRDFMEELQLEFNFSDEENKL